MVPKWRVEWSRAVSPAPAAPLRIGGNSVWGEFFRGSIDEVRIYSRALTQAEIQQDMITPIPLPPPRRRRSANGTVRLHGQSWHVHKDAAANWRNPDVGRPR